MTNAYELAVRLETKHYFGDLNAAANMLRQQADRIAELEKQIQIIMQANKDSRP